MATTAVAPAKATSVFADVPEAPADPILGLNSAFLADEAPNKISLGVGAFRTDEGKPYVLPVVKRVEQQLVRFSCFLIASFPFWSSGVVRGRKRRGGGGLAGEAYCAAILAHLLLPQSGCAAVVSSEQGQPVRTAWPTSSWGSLFFSFAELATDRVVFGVPPLLVPFSPPPPPPLAPDGRTQAADPATNHEYLPIDGLPAFQKLSAELILGKDSKAMKDGRVVTIQALSVRFVWVVLVGAGGVCGVLAC